MIVVAMIVVAMIVVAMIVLFAWQIAGTVELRQCTPGIQSVTC